MSLRGDSNNLSGKTAFVVFVEQQFGDRRGDVGKAFPTPEIARLDRRPGDQNRHMLAGMIKALENRIATVIGGDDEQFILA